jgi:drug/metabolite transporter (DMT)-like permease
MFSQLKDSVSMTLVGLSLAVGAVAIALILLWWKAQHLGRGWFIVVGLLVVGAGIAYTLASDRSG